MNSHSEKQARVARRLMVEAFLLGWLIAGALYVLDAPVWACYLACVPAIPLLVMRLLQMEPPREEPTLTRRESLTGWLRLCSRRLRRSSSR